jgi:hypothetical protein
MNKIIRIIILSLVLLTIDSKSLAQSSILFSDIKDSKIYTVKYFVLAEGELSEFRADLSEIKFENSYLNDLIGNINKKSINVVFVRFLSGKKSKKVERIVFYSTREQETKLIEELTLNSSTDSKDIDVLAMNTILK